MLSYIWPVILIVLSNIFYQICAKSVPNSIDPFASLSVTYAIGTVASLFCYFVINRKVNLIEEYSHLNWAPIVLGLSVVGLEVGLFMHINKVGR